MNGTTVSKWTRHIATAAGPLVAGVLTSFAAGMSPNTPPTSAGEIKLGMSTALTGTAAKLGSNMRAGVEAALAEANKNGGVHGRKVTLTVLDDGYEPSKTAPNMRKLIDEEKVVAVIGNVGTPTAVVAVPIAQEMGVAFFGAFTGAGVLRKEPPDRCVINYRASYKDETAAMVNALINHAGIKPGEVAFFTQRDAYGDAGFNGGVAALKVRGLDEKAAVIHGRYDRNTDAVEDAVAEMLSGNSAGAAPKAVIMVGTAPPSAKFVKLCRESGLDALFLSVSFVGANELAALLGKDGDGVIVMQVVPHCASDLPIAKEFRNAIAPEFHPMFNAFEGYITGRIMLNALRRIEQQPTRADVILALESLGKFDIGLGEPLELSSTRHQACNRVWATRLEGGKVAAFDLRMLKPAGAGAASVTEGR